MKVQKGITVPPYSFFYLDPRWGWVIIAIPGRFIPRKETHYPLYRRLDGPQGRTGRVRKTSLLPEFDPRPIPTVASRYIDHAFPAPRVLNCCCFIYCNLFMSNYSLFSNESASVTIRGIWSMLPTDATLGATALVVTSPYVRLLKLW
jgi:hypothetical protein